MQALFCRQAVVYEPIVDGKAMNRGLVAITLCDTRVEVVATLSRSEAGADNFLDGGN